MMLDQQQKTNSGLLKNQNLDTTILQGPFEYNLFQLKLKTENTVAK